MKKATIALGSIGMALLVMACSGGSDTPAPFTTAESDGLVKLSELTGATWKSDQGVAGSVALYFASGPGKPVLPNAARSPNDVLALLAPLAPELGIQGGLESELHDGEILSDASDEEPGVYRFRQHAPGSDVPVFDADLVVAVTAEGDLRYVSTSHARGLAAERTKPSMTPDDAMSRAAEALNANVTPTSKPKLGFSAADPAHPRLVYRFSVEMRGIVHEVDCDAHTGAVLAARPQGAAATAFSAASQYASDDIRQEKNAHKTVYLDATGGMSFAGPTGQISVFDQDRKLVKCTELIPAQGPVTHQCDASVTGKGAKGLAVDVQSHLLFASRYFSEQLGLRTWSKSGRVDAYVNVTTVNGRDMRGDGRFVPPDSAAALPALFLGRGLTFDELDTKKFAGNQTYALYPAGTSLDFVTHEYAHGVIDSLRRMNFSGEAGALHEALADVFAAHAEALKRGSPDGLFAFADDVRSDGRPLRHFLHPAKGADVGGTVDYEAIKPTKPTNFTVKDLNCLNPVDAKSGAACAITCVMDANRRSANDCGNVHYNSTIVSNAWTLLAVGGFNEATKKGVLTEVGLSKASRLFVLSLLGAPTNDTFKLFAERMISAQVASWLKHPHKTDLEPLWVKRAIVCAWNAVNVVTDAEVPWHGVGLSCPKAGNLTKRCDGKADGVYCSPELAQPYDAYVCQKGATRSGQQCASGTFCHRTGLSPDSPAVTKANGTVECFPEPMPTDW